MLSYRHAFHAGNHADVLKHLVFVRVLRHLAAKDKAFSVIDTHAGGGDYRLSSAEARKNAEAETGIQPLWRRTDAASPAATAAVPEAVADYLAALQAFDPSRRTYPGSPRLALALMRPQDRLRCFELHPTESRLLARNLATAGRQASVVAADGFEACKAVLPPPSRRGVVLIDPSYEDKRDYARTRRVLADGLARFATGTYLIWYPLVRRHEALALPAALARTAPGEWLDATLTVRPAPTDGFGLYGSGVFVVNPPWTLAEELRKALPWLAEGLGQGGAGAWTLRTQADAAPRSTPSGARPPAHARPLVAALPTVPFRRPASRDPRRVLPAPVLPALAAPVRPVRSRRKPS